MKNKEPGEVADLPDIDRILNTIIKELERLKAAILANRETP